MSVQKIVLGLSLILWANIFCIAQSDKVKHGDAILSLSFNELPNTIQVIGEAVQYSKFSRTLRINCQGITQFKGTNTAYTFSLTLPNFDFNNGASNSYTNENSHFFDANKDAALMLTIGNIRFGNLFRSKDKEAILSKVATTDYAINASNTKDKKGFYFINIRINKGSILQESSESKNKTEEETLHIAADPESQIKIINPQPSLPKVESYKFKSSTEVIRPTGSLK